MSNKKIFGLSADIKFEGKKTPQERQRIAIELRDWMNKHKIYDLKAVLNPFNTGNDGGGNNDKRPIPPNTIITHTMN